MHRIIQRGKNYVGDDGKLIKEPTIVECCGEQLECYGFTNTCDLCGADFNSAGQRLAPRSQWGEETGEHPSDIVNMREPWDDNY
jgi:hypothetical protein